MTPVRKYRNIDLSNFILDYSIKNIPQDILYNIDYFIYINMGMQIAVDHSVSSLGAGFIRNFFNPDKIHQAYNFCICLTVGIF